MSIHHVHIWLKVWWKARHGKYYVSGMTSKIFSHEGNDGWAFISCFFKRIGLLQCSCQAFLWLFAVLPLSLDHWPVSICCDKTLNWSNLKKEGFVSAHGLRGYSPSQQKVWGGLSHCMHHVTKQGETNTNAPWCLPFYISFCPELQPMV